MGRASSPLGPPRTAWRCGHAGTAGANEHKSDDDGIMTALETAGLSLWGTKLVVLSACDTGVGEVRTGEGAYGLRRALVRPDQRVQVMSLWPVDDEATRDLMVDYYKALQAGQGRSEGLRLVQLKMLSDPKRSHPAYWASFIQSGQWKNWPAQNRETSKRCRKVIYCHSIHSVRSVIAADSEGSMVDTKERRVPFGRSVNRDVTCPSGGQND